jgi:hypothetical protein
MLITAFFTENGVPKTGLSPTIRIRTLSDNVLVITDALMAEVGDGFYKYDFTTYNGTLKYSVRCDGGATLSGSERYTFGTNDSFAEDITDQVWDEALANHPDAGTYGNELATSADIQASASTVRYSAVTGIIINGDLGSGTLVNTEVRDDMYWVINENASNGLTVEFTFNLASENHKPGVFSVFGRYEGGGSTHYIELWAWNVESVAWELLHEIFIPKGTTDNEYIHDYFENHIDRGNDNLVRMRLVHNITTYSSGHSLHLDMVSLSAVEVITSQDISDQVWADAPDEIAFINNLVQSPTMKLDSKDIDRGATWTPRFELEVTDTDTEIRVDITEGGGNVLSKATANVSGGGDDQVKLIATGDAFLIYRIYISATETSLFGSGKINLNITSTLSDNTRISNAYVIPTSSTSAITWTDL